MLSSLALLALALTGSGVARSINHAANHDSVQDSAIAQDTTGMARDTATGPTAAATAAATAPKDTPTGHVPGKVFDRIMIVWLENTDYDAAAADPSLAKLAARGLSLSNYFAVTHPSQPNYVASIGGDNFGLNHDGFTRIDKRISTVIDLLEDKGISWAEYQEDMPYSGFQGGAYVNQQNGKNDYVRKHNPAVIYDANTTPQRLAVQKNLAQFYQDLENDKLPQWMFVTPNMTSDGHDSSVTTAGEWSHNFLTPLLDNPKFAEKTLVVLSFDENHTYTIANRVYTILLGGALPAALVGKIDTTFYDHYSQIASVEANWDLHTLGRWDVGANVFDFVAEVTGDKNRPFDAISNSHPTRFLNESFAGPLNQDTQSDYPAPNLGLERNGRTVLPSIAEMWKDSSASYYADTVIVPDAQVPPPGYEL